jgi:uncharacterized phosphatase
MTEIFLVRHGETYAKTIENELGEPFVCGSGSELSRDTHLTDNGKKQMYEVGKNFQSTIFDIVIISDLIRSKESAEEFLKGAGQENLINEMMVDPDISEINYGEDDGVSELKVKEKKQKYFADYPEHNNNFEFAFPGAESFAKAGKRMRDALVNITNKYPNKKVLILSHSGSMRALHLTGQISEPDTGIAIGQDLKFGEVMRLKFIDEKLEIIPN